MIPNFSNTDEPGQQLTKLCILPVRYSVREPWRQQYYDTGWTERQATDSTVISKVV